MKVCRDHGEAGMEPEMLKRKNPLTGEEYESPNPAWGTCWKCRTLVGTGQHHDMRVGRARLPGIREFVPEHTDLLRYTGPDDPEKRAQHFMRVISNPVDRAMLAAEMRRPSKVSQGRYGIALRSAMREPMLNAGKATIESREYRGKSPKHKLQRSFRVKPDTLKASRYAGGWNVRDWQLWSLQYAPGFVVVNHNGDESEVFPSWHKARLAIEEAGYVVLR